MHGTPRKNLQLVPLKGEKEQAPVVTRDHKVLEGVLVFTVADLIKHLSQSPDDRSMVINISEVLLASELREFAQIPEPSGKEKAHGKT
jgi:hypothetical protein